MEITGPPCNGGDVMFATDGSVDVVSRIAIAIDAGSMTWRDRRGYARFHADLVHPEAASEPC